LSSPGQIRASNPSANTEGFGDVGTPANPGNGRQDRCRSNYEGRSPTVRVKPKCQRDSPSLSHGDWRLGHLHCRPGAELGSHHGHKQHNGIRAGAGIADRRLEMIPCKLRCAGDSAKRSLLRQWRQDCDVANYFESEAGDGNRTNTIDQCKALLPGIHFNWSQMEASFGIGSGLELRLSP
jgi:hypothetical protein